MRFTHGLRIAGRLGLAVVGFAVLVVTDVVRIAYTRSFYDNAVLTNPVRVSSVLGRTLLLADGRRIEMLKSYLDVDVSAAFAESGGRVELKQAGDHFSVFVSRRRRYCGTVFGSRAPLILIPVIPIDYPTNQRFPLGGGVLVAR